MVAGDAVADTRARRRTGRKKNLRTSAPFFTSRIRIAATCVGLAVVAGACSRKEHGVVAASSASSAASAAAVVVDAAPAVVGPPKDLAGVVLISIDSLRADMPWAGYPRPIAPRLTELAGRAVAFTRAYALSSYTSMSLGGLLAGKLPGELKRDGYFFGTYTKDDLFFPELLQQAHVFTVAAHAHGYFKNARFEQGFDDWQIVPDLKWNNTTDENVTSPALEALAEKQLSDPRTESGRFFAWYHFMDPHDRYNAHEGVGPYGKSLRDRYDAEVTFTDEYVGKLLDFIAKRPWGARVAVIVTADHGEAFGEHGQYAHGFELWQNLVRVPLFVVAPGAKAHAIDTPRSAIDVAPTICALLGVAPDAGFEGKSLVPEVYGATPEPRDVAIDLPATSDNDRRRALVHGETKVIAAGAQDLASVYDLAADPDEAHPLKGDAAKDAVERYKQFEKTVVDVAPYQCKDDCLNGGYLKKKDGGAPGGDGGT